MKKFESKYNINDTIVGIEKGLKKMHTSSFAIYGDSSKIAHSSAMIFGSPKIKEFGTKEVVELPLKVVVWKDEQDLVWIAFEQMSKKAQRYGLQNSSVVEKIDNMLMDFAITCCSESAI